MKRSLMQAYVRGSGEAVAMYQKAFDAALVSSYPNDDGTYYHSELDIEGEILAVAERNSDNSPADSTATGNVMQFCLHYGEGGEEKLRRAYDVLKEGADIIVPLAPCDYSLLMTDLIDRYGVRWCLFI